MIRAVIIEDEINNRELLQHMIVQYVMGVDVVAFAVNVSDGIDCIKEHNPDLVFLDVEMPGGTGFDILKHFSNPKFKVIFVTGYEHYALTAIKHSAIDYLLKPINLDELKAAISKIKAMEISHAANIEFVKNHIESDTEVMTHLLISHLNINDTIIIAEILYVETQDRYTVFHLTDNRRRYSSLSLSFFESILDSTIFFRIHRSIIVNCHYVKYVSNDRAAETTMSNGAKLQVAYRRKSKFLDLLSGDSNEM